MKEGSDERSDERGGKRKALLPGDSQGGFMAIYERVISLKSSNRGGFDRIYVSTHSLLF